MKLFNLSVVYVGALLLGALILACGSDSSPNSEPAAPSSSPARAPTESSGSAAPTVSPVPTMASQPLAPVSVERVFPSLGFVRSTGMYEVPGTNRFVVTQQRGVISIFDNRPEAQDSTFIDLTDRVASPSNEEGLLGLAFAPDFERSGVFYLNYTAASPRRTVIARFQTNADRSRGDPASEEVLIEISQPYPNHKGGQIAFGPDGYLYIGMGDGGSANDPEGRAQNLNELLGKILRIDVSGSSDGLEYRIPADNPFVGRQGARPEIWAYGMRNPWRFSFDPASGDLWAGDVGQNAFEEIDIIEKGQNYGWDRIEGNRCVGGGSCDRTGTVAPVIDYPTSGSECSVTGGFVYRGSEIASLTGAYVYGDYCSGRIWALRYDGNRITEQMEIADTNVRISSFAVDSSGNLYVVAHGEAPNGAGLFRIAPR